MSLKDRLTTVLDRFEHLTSQLSDPELASHPRQFQDLSKERSTLENAANLGREYLDCLKRKAEAQEMIEAGGEMAELAGDELRALNKRIPELEEQIRLALLPKDPFADKDIFLEIRAGAGGEEASLFAQDLFRMYSKYAADCGWRLEMISESYAGQGGYKEVVVMIRGHEVYNRLKYESGVHRVQRIPTTESSGRIHTSTVTVAVLPEAEETDLDIHTKDLRIDVFRAGGKGGQGVNTTDSAVRITHLPTNTVVICQDERSQIKNKAKALSVLRSRLLTKKLEDEAKLRSDSRKSQVGTGDRSERIRTYNFPQERVTDHRINLTLKKLTMVINGDLNEIIDALQKEDYSRKLAEAEGA